MAKRKPKPKMMWKVTLFGVPVLVDIKGTKPYRNGYVGYFKSEQDAVDYKWEQLVRIRAQYALLNERLPEDYSKQIEIMEKEYAKGKKIS